MSEIERKEKFYSIYNYRNSTSEDAKLRPAVFNLPVDAMFHIFSYLEPSCLLYRVGLVCKAWKKMTENLHLWKEVYLDGTIRGIDHSNVLNKYQLVEDLILYKCKIDNSIIEAISQLHSLRFLMAIKCTIANRESTDMVDLKVPYLKLVDIYDVGSFLDYFDLEFTTRLEFIKCTVYESRREFFSKLKKCQLEYLCIIDYEYSNTVFDGRLVNALIKRNADTLIKIYIQGTYSNEAFLNLDKCSELREVRINLASGLDSSVLSQIKDLGNLRSLFLVPCFDFSSSCLIEAFNEGQLGNLTHLHLFFFKGSRDFCTAIADCCRNLTVLELVDCDPITDSGLSAIIKKCPEIVELYLTQLPNVRGVFLLEMRENVLKRLKKIKLSSVFVDKKYVTELRKARPELQIKFRQNYL